MQRTLIKLKTVLKDIRYVYLISFFVLDLLLVALIIFLGYKIYNSYVEYDSLKSKNEQLKSEVELITKNKNLLSKNIKSYNLILENLIPNSETYFQVISALEKLQLKTGVIIDSYSINLESTTENKLSLALSIKGNRDTIDKLFKDHKFISGRLITNETMTIDPKSTELSYDVNLYHDPNPGESGSSDVIITYDDLILLDGVVSLQE